MGGGPPNNIGSPQFVLECPKHCWHGKTLKCMSHKRVSARKVGGSYFPCTCGSTLSASRSLLPASHSLFPTFPLPATYTSHLRLYTLFAPCSLLTALRFPPSSLPPASPLSCFSLPASRTPIPSSCSPPPASPLSRFRAPPLSSFPAFPLPHSLLPVPHFPFPTPRFPHSTSRNLLLASHAQLLTSLSPLPSFLLATNGDILLFSTRLVSKGEHKCTYCTIRGRGKRENGW